MDLHKVTFSILLLLSLYASPKAQLSHNKLRLAAEETPNEFHKVIMNMPGSMARDGHYKINLLESGDFSYYGIIVVQDTVTGASHSLTIPILYTSELANDPNFFHVDETGWWFIAKSSSGGHGSALSQPTVEEDIAGIVFQYKFSSTDHGKTWLVERLPNLETRAVDDTK